jgi:hypothetical protein
MSNDVSNVLSLNDRLELNRKIYESTLVQRVQIEFDKTDQDYLHEIESNETFSDYLICFFSRFR